MQLFPTKDISFGSSKTLEELYEAIDYASTAGYNEEGIWRTPVVGERTGNTFNLKEGIAYRITHLFAPTAYGTLVENENKHVEIRLQFRVFDGTRKWFILMAIIFALGGLLATGWEHLVIAGVLLFVPRLGFNSELEGSIKVVREYLE